MERWDRPLAAGLLGPHFLLTVALGIATGIVLLASLRLGQVPGFTAWLLFVPALLFISAVLSGLPTTAPTLLRDLGDRLRSVRPIWPVALAALTVSFTVAQFANNAGPWENYWTAFGLWLTAVVATVAAALAPAVLFLRQRDRMSAWLSTYRWDVVAAVGLTIAALVPRLVNLSGVPTPFSGDEAAMGLQATRVIKGEVHSMFESGLQGHPTAYFFELAGFFKVFGVSVMAQRMWSALIGAAAVPMLYLLLRSWFGRTVALMGAGYLVAYHFDLHFSRIAMNNIGDPFLLTVCVYLGWRASRTLAPEDFVLAGVALGLSLYFYVGARVTPLAVGAILVFAALSRPQTIPQMMRGGVMLVLGYGIAALPLGVFWMTHQDQFMDRLNSTGIFQSGWFDAQLEQGRSTFDIMWEQVRRSFGAFGYYKDISPHYLAPISFVDRASLVPFLVGFLVSVVRIRDVRYFALIVMFVGAVATGSVLTVLPPTSPRLMGAVPSVAVWVGLGLTQLAGWLAFGRGRQALALASVGLAFLISYNLHFYFFQYRTGEYYSDYNTRVAEQVANYVKTLPDDTRVFWYGAPRMFISGSGHPAMTFPIRDWSRFDVMEDGSVVSKPQVPLTGDTPTVFMFLPHRGSELGPVADACPGGEVKTFISEAGRKGASGYQEVEQTSFTAYEVLVPNDCLPITASADGG